MEQVRLSNPNWLVEWVFLASRSKLSDVVGRKDRKTSRVIALDFLKLGH